MKFWTVGGSIRLKKIINSLSIEDGKYICRLIYSDPFTDIYSILLILYVFVLGGFLLWPFDFLIRNDARWVGNSNGIEFLKMGQAMSNSSTQELFDRLVNGRGLTLEAWIQTEDLNQDVFGMILSYSLNADLCNFAIGQEQDHMVFRLRTTETDLNGMKPLLFINNMFNYRSLQHIVIVYDFNEERVYIDGIQRARSNILKGNFSNWDASCKLVIGNDLMGNRPWKGKLYYVAIFNRPMTEKEIRQNYLSGLPHRTNTYSSLSGKSGSTKDIAFKAKGPVARYFFDEGNGNVVHDSGSDSSPVNLFIPKYIENKIKPFLDFSMDNLQSKSQLSDIIINILIFIPLGILIHGTLRTRYILALKISLVALLAGTLFSIGIESLQHFSMTRNSSFIDVATNMIGTSLGIVIDRAYMLFLNYRFEHLQRVLYDR